MTRVHLLVEGQTEEAFVRELLAPQFANIGVYLNPILIATSPTQKGGMVSYAKTRPQIVRKCREDPRAFVSTMFDLYALPRDFPGRNAPGYPAGANGAAKAAFLEVQLAADIAHERFVPNIVVHEFEALLFTQPERFGPWVDDDRIVGQLQAIRRDAVPEDINELPHTAPSKRILAAMPGYQKTLHGPLIAKDIGLDAMRAQCPHFDGWLRKLEALANR
ncbi:MAG TPA: DUF4276 family protein [Tahibacter sp.]|nr:DUF4276 family protein [Tahibacter sp.]